MVLVHVGTNDTNDPNFAGAIDELDALITRIATTRPKAHIIATTLMKRGTTDAEPKYVAIANEFNPYVLPLVQKHQALGRRVHFLDMHAMLERSDMSDNLHPHAAGYAKMAAAWFPAVTNIVGHYGDKLPPGISSVRVVNATTLTVAFSKPINITASPAAINPASYTLSPGGSVTAVSALSADLRKVTLTVSDLTPNVTSSLSFNGAVTDLVPPTAGGPYTANLSGSPVAFSVPPASGLATDNLPAGTLNGWEPLYTLNIPNTMRYGLDSVGYDTDNAAAYANAPLARVAYYMALQRLDQPLDYVWVELDAFTQDAAKLGVPTAASGAFFQQPVSNLTVISTSQSVTSGAFAGGNIEFWPCNYSVENSASVPGASASIYDFGDKPTNGDYGSMQIHNTAARETLFAFNHWGSASVNYFTPCLGIGNNPNPSATSSGGQLDWTFLENGQQFATKVLQVFVKRAAIPPPRPAPTASSAHAGYSGTAIRVDFSSPIAAYSVTPAAFSLDRGVTVIDASLFSDGKTVTLITTPQPTNAPLTLTVAGVRDAVTGTAAPTHALPVSDLPAEITANAGALANGYKIVYTLDIPVISSFGGTAAAPYTFNAAAGAMREFDRVAYYLELGNRPAAPAAADYLWTSMDAFTPSLSKIGVPNVFAKTVFAQYVTNLTVKSNKSGVTSGGFDIGNIEFWPSNYATGNADNIPEASGTTYDFGDGGYTSAQGYGSMQVHNFTLKQTLFAINNWGSNNRVVELGIGNCTLSGMHPDWTHTYNAAAYSYRRLHILARPKTDKAPASLPPPAEVLAKVPGAAGFSHIYTIDIPLIADFANQTSRAAYYSVDNSDLFTTPHSRVAYYFELVKNNVTSYCWTAFDPISPGVKNIGVPVNNTVYQQQISNLDVRSNVAGVTAVTGSATGNIEFWPYNYTIANGTGLPNANASVFDFDDTRSTSGAYGSMQVHNYGAQQVLWAISRFNTTSEVVNTGIGNSPSSHPDYTHSGSGANWDSRRLLVFAKPIPPPPPAIPPEVLANVPCAADFHHLYTVDIPLRATFNNATARESYYSVNNAARYSDNGLAAGRVGYYLELVKNNVTSFCWTAFDSFTPTVDRLSVPYDNRVHQQPVINLDVISNVAGVINTNGCNTGNIEFWPYNYTVANSLLIPNGSEAGFDFGDNCSYSGAYGSMQVHNYGAQQVLWAISRFNTATDSVNIGIGNNPNASQELDYTHSGSGANWDSRRLLVFIRPVSEGTPVTDTMPPTPSRAIGQTSLDRALVFFNEPVSGDSADPANFTSSGGIDILGAAMHPVYSNTCVILTTTPQTPGTAYTLTVNNIRDRSYARNVSFPNHAVTFTAQAEPEARPDFLTDIPEAAEYTLVQKIDIVRNTQWAGGANFSLDDTWPNAPHFDRVAYALDLMGTNNIRRWIWVSMDTFTTDPLRIGIPTADRSARFQQSVSNLTVAVPASVPNVTAGSFADGNIEFWPNDYQVDNEAGVPGANASAYDFGDRISPTVMVGYGSMQVHNFRLGQTLFAMNDWGSNNRAIELGIGPCPFGTHSDWTFTDNEGYVPYKARTFYTFIRPAVKPPLEQPPVPGWGTLPMIILSPYDMLLDIKDSATLMVLANGAERYQWRKDGVFIPGATLPILTIPEVYRHDAGDYDVLVYGNGSKYAVSLPARLTVKFKGTLMLMN